MPTSRLLAELTSVRTDDTSYSVVASNAEASSNIDAATVPDDLYYIDAAPSFVCRYFQTGWVNDTAVDIYMSVDINSRARRIVGQGGTSASTDDMVVVQNALSTTEVQSSTTALYENRGVLAADIERAALRWRSTRTGNMGNDVIDFSFDLLACDISYQTNPHPGVGPYVVQQDGYATASTVSPDIQLISGYSMLEGDYIIAFIEGGSSAPLTLPTGWEYAITGKSVVHSGYHNHTTMVMHQYTASDVTLGVTSWSLTNLWSVATINYVNFVVVRGAHPTAPFASSGSYNPQTLTETDYFAGVDAFLPASCLLISGLIGTGNAQFIAYNNGGWIPRGVMTDPNGNQCMAERKTLASGAVGNELAYNHSGNFGSFSSITIAVKPPVLSIPHKTLVVPRFQAVTRSAVK